jgi:DNA polymerase III epsilon subunit family exonuclease
MAELAPELRIVALDVETTGLSPMRDRIVELAAVAWQAGREAGAFQELVNPGRPMPHAALRVHGITDAMLADKPPVSEHLPAFLAFCQADMLIAHNARFDLSFIREECGRCGLPMLDIPVYDTCALARQLLPTAPRFSLEAVKGTLGIGRGQEHRALSDARDCLHVFLRFIAMGFTPEKPRRELSNGEQSLLADLLSAVESRRRIRIEYRDGRGRMTTREVLPLSWTEDDLVLEAHCFLRDEVRHFYLQRIRRVWLIDKA